MKAEFVLFKENSNKPISVSEKSNKKLLQRCQDHWYHTKEKKFLKSGGWVKKIGSSLFGAKGSASEYLFIHIPKTGGTSFKFNVLYNPHFEKDVLIYHKFNYPPKNKSELNIFKERRQMFTLLRDPVKTVISSYYHFNHIQKTTLMNFCKQASNMQLKFLLGYDITSSYEVTENDLNKVKGIIDKGKLIVGILKTAKMKAVYDLLELPINKVDNYVLNKKSGFKYNLGDIPKSTKEQILEMNGYDQLLFDYVKNA
ncbi:MAG: hypothetical protein RIC95_11265 [Vicingaceae bacterium]